MSRLLAVLALVLLTTPALAWPPRLDALGDPLPPGAVARFGTIRWRHAGAIRNVAWSRDGKTLFTCAEDRTVRAWDATTGRETARPEPLQGSWRLTLSADGHMLAGLRDQEVVLLDLKTGARQSVPCKDSLSSGFCLSPDGKLLALGDTSPLSGEMNAVTVWDTSTGKSIKHIFAHGGGVRSLVFTPDGRTLISGGGDSRLCVWDTKTWAELACEAAHVGDGGISSLAVSANGKVLVSAGACPSLRDPATGKLRRNLDGRGGAVHGVAVSPDGRRVVSHHGDLSLRMCDADSGNELWRTALLNPVPGMEPAFSPDGKTLAVAACAQTLRLFDVETGKRLNLPTGHDSQPTALALSPDGKWLAVGGYQGTAHLWDTTRHTLAHSLPVGGAVRAFVFSPDGKTLAVPANNGLGATMTLWDVLTGKKKNQLPVPGSPSLGHEVTGLAFSADGKSLSGHTIMGLSTWDVETGKITSARARALESSFQQVRSPDGLLALEEGSHGWELFAMHSMTDSGILPGSQFPLSHSLTLRDAVSGTALMRLEDKTTIKNGLDRSWQMTNQVPDFRAMPPRGQPLLWYSMGPLSVFSPDGRLLASRNYRNGVTVWELASGKVLSQHPVGNLRHLWFCPDGRTIGAAAGDRHINLWDALTGKDRGECAPPVAASLQTLSADGRLMATAHDDTSVLLWDLAVLRPAGAPQPAAADELDRLWSALGSENPAEAYAAMDRLAATPESLALLKKHLRPGTSPEEERVAKWIEDLNAQRFAVRQSASRELKKSGATARPALIAVLANKPTLEVRRRIEAILDEDNPPARLVAAGEPMRQYRAVQVLERMRTREAGSLLEQLADGPAHAALSRHARAALARIGSR